MDILQNIDYSAFQSQMMDEIDSMLENTIQDEIHNSKTYQKYKSYECLYVNNISIKLTDTMLREIQWLIHYVKDKFLYLYEDYRESMLEKYDKIIHYLPALFDSYSSYTNDEKHRRYYFEPIESIKNIRQIMLPFRDCVNREKFDKSFVDYCVKLLEFYKFTACFMLNRLEELEFDLEYMKEHPEYIAGH